MAQYLEISEDYTLSDLGDRVGDSNIDNILALNSLSRTPNIGEALSELVSSVKSSTSDISSQRKVTLLNSMVEDSDVFEKAALSDDNEWKVIDTLGTFSNYLAIPESITLNDATDILGNSKSVGTTIYNQTMSCLSTYPYVVDPVIFNEYSTIKNVQVADQVDSYTDAMSWFPIPWGDVTLYSSLTGESKDFPVYPEDYKDSTSVTYDTMPDILYQYEPWLVYNSTGPREIPFTFHFHRDMWTGDHRDGKANELIRFCQGALYPEYSGSAIATDIVTMYIKGEKLITGILKDFSVKWSGPLGLDGFYLECELDFTIQEVSENALSASVVRAKGLIG